MSFSSQYACEYVAFRYRMNRFVYWGFNYRYTQRKSDAGGRDYIENLFVLTARLQY